MNKEYLKSKIYAVEVRIAGQITAGIINRASKRETLRSVKAEILRLPFSDVEKNQLWLYAVAFYRHTIAAAARETDVDTRIEKVYSVLRRDEKILEGVKNTVADSVEFRYKHDEIRRIVTGDHIFYRCSTHSNCAKGHLDYQGKLYVIADWRKKIDDPGDQEKIARFIDQEKIMTVEEVTGADIWLVTRRNCKHRLSPVPLETILNGQTDDSSDVIRTRNIGYAESQYHTYRDRLKMLEKMKAAFEEYGQVPAQMKLDMKNTRRLMKQWRLEMTYRAG